MSDRVQIGNDVLDGAPVEIDASVLVDTRLLVQGNSGAGKSRMLRRLAEQTAGKVQTIILDPEGEFSTLREHFAFVLAGRGGEVPTHPATASQLARKLMELRTSAVVDLYDLRLPDRREFVAAFLDSLLSIPKALYGSVLVMIDEAHLFCPEGERVASTDAVIALMCQGRKRGMCGVLAEQRLSKLHKDAAAECNNVVIGRTQLDTDQARAAGALGLSKAQAVMLRDLGAGEFRGFGPAFAAAGRRGIVDFKSGDVVTTHPRAGERHKLKPPAPPAAIMKFAAQLSEIPAEVEAQENQADLTARRLADAGGRILELERDLAEAQSRAGLVPLERLIVPEAELARLATAVEVAGSDLRDRLALTGERFENVASLCRALIDSIRVVVEDPSRVAADVVLSVDLSKVTPAPLITARREHGRTVIQTTDPYPPAKVRITGGQSDGPQRVLDMVVAMQARGVQVNRESVARWLGLHPNGGRYGRWIAELRDTGRLRVEDWGLTPEGRATSRRAVAGGLTAFLDHLSAIDQSGPRRVLETVIASKTALTRETLAAAMGIHPNGGRYGRWLKLLRDMCVLTDRGPIAATAGVFK